MLLFESTLPSCARNHEFTVKVVAKAKVPLTAALYLQQSIFTAYVH